MKEALEKIIYKMIFGKYSWIEDFEVKVYTFRPGLGGTKKIAYQDYAVIYYVHSDEVGTFTVIQEFEKVEELTETLFKMLGPENYQRFKGVEFKAETK